MDDDRKSVMRGPKETRKTRKLYSNYKNFIKQLKKTKFNPSNNIKKKLILYLHLKNKKKTLLINKVY